MSGAARLAAALAGGLACLLAGACDAPVPREEVAARLDALERPDLVLIVVDTLRADWTTPYGDAAGTTPELARWAERGVVFENALAQSSWTKISMASLLTSTWPRTHGITRATDGLAGEATTVAEALRAAGYATWAVQTNGWLDQSFGFQQGFDRYLFPRGEGAVVPGARAQIWPHAERVLQEAFRVLEERDPARPFFLYVHFMDVHEYASPPEFRTFGDDAEGDYRAAMRWVDDALLRLRREIERRGLAGRAVLVFGADHGEAFGENQRTGHARNVLSAVIHVPLVLRLPFAVEPVRVGARVRNVDIAPTLLDLAGVKPPESFEGRSLLPLLEGRSEPERPSFAGLGDKLYPDAQRQLSVQQGRWTYARNLELDGEGREATREELLFDRSVDPGENVDLIAHEPEAAERMRRRLDAHLAERRGRSSATPVHIDPEIADRLRAMGYLQ